MSKKNSVCVLACVISDQKGISAESVCVQADYVIGCTWWFLPEVIFIIDLIRINLSLSLPLSQDNVVCLSPRLAQSLGNLGQVCVCIQVTSTVHLIDPKTLQREYDS